MSQITSPATYSISRPQDVIDIVNKNSAINTSIGVIFIALGGILIDAYQAAMVGFGNKYIAAQFGISPGLAATVNASVLIAALIGGLLANRVINRFGQKRAFIIGMGLCTIGAAAVAIAPSIWWVLVCRVIMGFGLGIDFPLATNAVAELRGSTSKKTGTSVNLWQMAWYVSTTVVYLVLLPLLLSGIAEEQLWRYGIFIGAIFAVIFMILRYFFIGESAMWAARVGRYQEACDILGKRYGVQARVAASMILRYFFIGESAMWAARVGRYQEACDILGKRYGVQARVAASGTTEAKFSEKAENKYSGGYGILFNDRYRKRTILGCVVATMQAWQYNAGTTEAKFSEKAENKYSGGYGILFNDRYRKRTILGCVVATMQAWQYNAVGVYLPLTLAGIISGGLTGALTGSAVVNALCGVTGGMIGSFILQRLGTRRQSMYGFAVVTLALLSLGALARDDRLVYSPTTGYSPTVDVWICCCDLSIAVVRRTGND